MHKSLNFLNVSRGTSGTEQSYRDPEQSPAGASTTTEPLADDIVARNRQLVADYADALYDASAEEILAWADEHVPGDIAVTMSMENTVLAELASRYAPRASLLFLDTGYHFDETLDVAKQVQQRYDQQFITATPTLHRNQQDEVYGPRLYASNPTACCRMRKVEPLARSLSPFAGWVTGLRRDDGPTRAQAPALSLDDTGRLKISPLVTWSLQDTEDYVDKHDLIMHPLTKQGYPSIGCATCTLPVAEGQDPRAGRWAGLNKTECGLHT
ncbi:phosphoadenylyl-sulfate reductase [Corynebacterium propinquum]|uniref:phosphoadenylyl-sulfate reductase n=1 Tax=Corynebacterium propinquum TaxID=43769 RepID=UPI0036F3F5C4